MQPLYASLESILEFGNSFGNLGNSSNAKISSTYKLQSAT